MSVVPLKDLVKRYFPMRGCNVKKFTEAVKGSRYFVEAWDNPKVVSYEAKIIAFKLQSQFFEVYFGLRKHDGVTSLEGASVRKE